MKRSLACVLFSLVSLTALSQEICNNGIDDDFDGFIDCYDGSCANDPACDGIFLGNDATCQSPPPVFPKFTMSLDFSSPNETTNHLSRMAIGDLDRDGVPEIVTMNRYTNTIFILNGNDGSVKKKNDTIQFEPYWEVAIANIDNDNCGEIYFIGYMKEISFTTGTGKKKVKTITRAGGVYMLAYDCDLNFLWRTKDPLPNDPINFGIADFDGDGKEEIYAKDEIYDAKTGVRIVKTSAPSYTNQNGGPVAVNILGDSKQELVIGLAIYQVNLGARTKDSGSLSLLQNRAEYFIRDSYNATSVADYNLDGFLDVLASGSTIGNDKNTTVFFWDVQNNTLKTYSDPQPALGSDYTNGWINGTGRLNIADLDGKNGMNASFVSGRFLYALDENFNLLWRVNINEETSGYTGCTLFDFNGDGKAEIVYRDERFLYIIEGADGSVYSQQACISRTNREYPIVADVDADGSTELCVTCGFNDVDAANNFNTLSYSRYSHVRVFKSAAEPWVPARRVWNQHGYFVVNVNDDLTIPTSLQAHHLVFSTGNCTQGPNRPLNKFLNQSPYLNSEGCPTYASADIAFAVEPTIIPPTCPNLNFTVSFKITNLGDVSLTGDIPITFYTTNPKRAGAVKLNTITASVTKLQKGDIFSIDNATVTGVGSDSLYVVLNDAGTTVPTPIVLPNTTFFECDYDNIRGVKVKPLPVSISALEVNGNEKCSAVSNGTARAFVPIGGGGENTADYNFYWSIGNVAKPIASIDYVGAIYSGIPDGTYTVYARHKTANCNSDTTQVVVSAIPAILPDVTVSAIANQTTCSPPNGKMEAVIAGGGAGYTIDWYDISLNPLGISGATANNLQAGSYLVVISKGGCTKTSLPATIGGPQVPDAQANVLQNVLDCSNPNSGSINADALLGGIVQDPANYTFSWFQYNNVTSVQGSALPIANGTGPTRTGLPVGYYQVEIKDNATKCVSTVKPIVQVTSQTAVPDPPQIVILSSQTSCDPLTPNGSMTANVTIGGVAQNPADYTFEWFKGQNTLPANLVTTVSDINGKTVNQVVGGGIPYTVRVTNAFNCSAIADLPVTENVVAPVVTLAQLSPNSICDPAKAASPYNGSVKATVTFGGNPVALPDPNYKFTWKDPSNANIVVADDKNPILSGIVDGNAYSVTVERIDLKCTSNTDSEPVLKTTVLPLLASSSTGSNNCDPALTPDGTVTVAVTNTAPGDVFQYQWYKGNAVVAANALGAANNGTSATAIKVGGPSGAPNQYLVSVLNTTSGCESTAIQFVADISVVPVLSFASVTPNSICSPATSFNGALVAQVDNQIGPISDYVFTWYNGAANTPGNENITSTSTALNQLDAGFYTVETKNNKTGCKSAPISNQVPDLKIYPALSLTSTGSNNCDPSLTPDGTATATVTNIAGAETYGFQWYAGNAIVPANILGAANNGTSATAIKLGGPTGAPKSYTVFVTNNATGCTNFSTVAVADVSIVPVLSFTNVTPNTICSPSTAFTGSVTVQVDNPVGVIGDYVFTWYNGNTNAPASKNTASTTTLLSNLDAGFYTVETTNTKTGCSSLPATNQVPNAKVLPAIAITSIGSNNCDPLLTPDGTITANVTNGGVSFSYQWSAVAPTTAITNLANNANQQTAIKLGGPTNAPNSYQVLVTNNATGCQNTAIGLVADVSQKPTLTLSSTPNGICDISVPGGPTAYNGHLDVTAVNHPFLGSSAITYEWQTADANGNLTGATGTNAASLTQRQAGKYAVRVKVNSLGCTSDYVVDEILDNLPAVNVVTNVQGSTNCAPAVNGNGLAEVTSPVGATIAYQWYDGVLVAPGQLIAGKTAALLGNNLQGGAAANYTVLVTNLSDGCRNNAVVNVPDLKVTPTIAVSLVANNTVCDIVGHDPDGELQATVGGVGANYTVHWTGGAPKALVAGAHDFRFTRLKADNYTAYVQDDNTGCQSVTAASIVGNNFTYPNVQFTVTPQTSCNALAPNGAITAADGIITASRTFEWFSGASVAPASGLSVDGGDPANQIDELASGDFTVRITNDNTGCASVASTNVPETITVPQISFTNVNPMTRCDAPDGSATPVLTNASANFAISYVFTPVTGTPPASAGAVVGAPTIPVRNTLAPYTGLQPGFVTGVVVNNTTGCTSNPTTVQILNTTDNYDIQLTAAAAAAACGSPNGGLDVTVSGGSGSYDFAWFDSTPTNQNINFYNNPPVFVPAGSIATTEDLGSLATPPDGSITTGTYTVVVTDQANGCGNYFVTNVPFADTPDVTITTTPNTHCIGPNGAISVDLTSGPVNTTGYSIVFSSITVPNVRTVIKGEITFDGIDNDGDGFLNAADPDAFVKTENCTNTIDDDGDTNVDGADSDCQPVNRTVSLLAEGDYLIQIYDNDPVNQNCPLEYQVFIPKNVAAPLITVDNIIGNTSCSQGLNSDGEVQLTVNSAAGDALAKDYFIRNLSPLPVGFTLNAAPGNIIGNGDPGQTTGLIGGFSPGAYSFRILDNISGCFTDLTLNVPDNQDLPGPLAVSATPETFCAPGSNGAALANTTEAETEFDFDWFSDAAATSSVLAAPAAGDGLSTGGELLNRNKVTSAATNWALNATNGLGAGDRAFFVRAVRNAAAASGVGCPTEIKQVVIPDQHLVPGLALTPTFNSFCTAVNPGDIGDGSIAITADANPNAVGVQNAVGGFTFSWTNANANLATPQDLAVNTLTIPNLATGTYVITARNDETGCITSATEDVDAAPFSISITDTDIANQLICDPNGQVDVVQITIDRTPASLADDVQTSALPLTNLYDFEWYAATAGNPTTFVATPLEDAASTIINEQSLVTGGGAGQFSTMGAGTYYVKATRKAGSGLAEGCQSFPLRVDVQDQHKNPLVTLRPFSNTSCSPAGEGVIEITVTDATDPSFGPVFTYDYDWTSGGIADATGNEGDATGANDVKQNLLQGTYALTVTNPASGCFTPATVEIIKNGTPVFTQSVDVDDQISCNPNGDGRMEVKVITLKDRGNVPKTSGVDFNITDFEFDWTRGGIAFTQTTAGATLDVGNYNATVTGFGTPIGAGTYTVVSRRVNGTPGAGCESAPYQVTIADKRLFPVVTLTPFANTSCDPLADEGEISVKVTDATAVPGPHTFTYAWNAGNPVALGTTLANDGDADGNDGDGDRPGALMQGIYQVTVTNDQSFCASTASTEIYKNSTPVFTQLVDALDQVLCGNDGSLKVKEVKLIDRDGKEQSNTAGDFPLTHFQFNWTKPAIAFAQTTAGPALNVGNYPAISFGEYYVSAERVTGAPGAKCKSTPFKVDILDRRIFPVGTLTPFANTSCDPAFPEGAISVKVSDGTTVPGPFTYTYTWDNVGNPTPIVTLNPGVNDGDAVSTDGDEDEPTNLLHGDYTVAIRNNQSGCQSNATTTIFKNATPIFIPQATATPQILCSADGSIEVNAVSLTDRTGKTQTASLAEFDFSWARATLANQVATTQGLNGAVAGGTILDRTIYNQIGFDTYYIVATRVTGNVGRGCASAPYRTDILDKRVFPEVTVATIPNSSCNVALPNGSVTINASEPNGTNAGPYTFAWGLNGGSVSSASVQTDTNNSSVLSNALDGNYVVTATNTITSCPVNRPLLVLLDQTRSTPNIIDVTTVDPLDCNPTGSATVTKITLGSTTNSSLFPPNVPPNNEVTGAGLLNFNYEWYKDSFGAGNQLPVGGPPFTTTPNINSLLVGTYFVLVHDPSTDCRSGLREVVIKPDNVIYPVLDVVQTAKQVGCLTTTGSAELAATADGQTSANANYAFTWFNNPDNTPPTIGSSSTISNLLAGTYSVTVRDNTTSCTASAAYIITDDTEEFRPVVSMGSQPRTLCVGTDGAIIARVINVDPSYPFPYDNTTFTADLYLGATPNLGATPDVPNMSLMSGFTANFMEAGLNEGFYTVRITDNNTGCVGIGTEEIKDARKYPVLAVEEIAPMTNCDPARPNGVAQATANGTFVGFQFDWYEGNAVSGTPVYTGAEYGEVKALPQVYVVRATDINSGCTSDLATSVKDATVPIPAPTIEVLSHVTSCLIDNGALGTYVGTDRNTKDYVFNWYDGTKENPPADYVGEIYTNLAKGNYSVTATSIVTGCKSPLVTGVVLIKQEFPEFNFFVQNSSCDKSDGYASLVLVSDVPIETIEWSNEVGPFLIGPNFTDAAAGVYTVTATSFLGCATTKEVEILPDIHAYNGISRNNDGRNEIFQIDCIQNFPSNIVKIFNRAGTLVYEAEGYDNSSTFFDGKSNRGLSPMGVNLPDGTYFYIVDKRDGSKPLAGYLEIVK